MPSSHHDTLNQMFRDRPGLAVEFLRDLLGVDLPDALSVQVESNDFNSRPSKDFQPDTMITVGPKQSPSYGVIVEIQKDKTEAKRRQLPRYASYAWLMLEIPIYVLMVCYDRQATAFYSQPYETGLPGYVFRSLVVGPDQVPVIVDPAEATASPELAAMGLMMHGSQNEHLVTTFVESLQFIDHEHATEYYEHAYRLANESVRRLLEEYVRSAKLPLSSPFAKEHFSRGLAEGEARGEAKGEADALLRFLDARGLQMTEEDKARIASCTDINRLRTWVIRAATVTTTAELFG